MLKKITSKENKYIKLVRSLSEKKKRDKENLFVIEGYKFIFSSKIFIPKFIIITENLLEEINQDAELSKQLNSLEVDIYITDDEIFNYITNTNNPQGALCVFEKNKINFENRIKELGKKERANIVICENLQDPGNAGTIIRTADAGGFDLVIFTNNSVDIFNPKVIRSTAGSILNIPVINGISSENVIQVLKKNNITSYGTHLKGEQYHFDTDFDKKTAFFIGNEANGLTDETSNMLDQLIKIPMLGNSESLNASIACAVVIYEIMRKNKF